MEKYKQIEKSMNQWKNVSVFMFGAILNLLAAIDFISLADYCVKAIAGGIIWLAFKVGSEVWAEKYKRQAYIQDELKRDQERIKQKKLRKQKLLREKRLLRFRRRLKQNKRVKTKGRQKRNRYEDMKGNADRIRSRGSDWDDLSVQTPEVLG
jgi:hypothetical protein